MSRYVIDASAAAEYILRTPIGRRLHELVEGAFLMAPFLLDVQDLRYDLSYRTEVGIRRQQD